MNHEVLLTAVGLEKFIIWIEGEPELFDKSIFDIYVSDEYFNSGRRETDDAYNMSEIVLLHINSGLRLEYSVRELNTMNEKQYKLMNIFISTAKFHRAEVVDADFFNRYFVTEQAKISFSETLKSGKY